MTERYLWAHSVMYHHNEFNVTKELVTGSCVTEWVERLASNEIERGMGIPTIESRASNISIDKGNCIRDWPLWLEFRRVLFRSTRSDKSQSRFMPTQQTLSEIPVVHLYSHPVTLWCLVHQSIPTVSGSCTISWSKETILGIRKALANELHDLVLCLGLGLFHHIILLMMWSRYQWHPMSMVRKR